MPPSIEYPKIRGELSGRRSILSWLNVRSSQRAANFEGRNFPLGKFIGRPFAILWLCLVDGQLEKLLSD